MIQKALMDSFGIACNIKEIQVKNLPVYMKNGRQLLKMQFEENNFLIVVLSPDDKFGTAALKKQALQYKQSTGMDVIYLFKNVTRPQRDALISNKISFICLPNQLYLLVMGVALKNHFQNESKTNTEKMMPATQSLFLYLLYQRKESVMKSLAAKELSLTKTSITRASGQLKAMGLITEDSEGKYVYMKPTAQGKELFEKAKPYLINPVQKTIYVAASKEVRAFLEAGETALSAESMLAAPIVKCLAVYKGNAIVSKLRIVDPQWTSEKPYYQVELWKYNPAIFSDNGRVDIVSLLMSLSDNTDERVQGELEDYVEDYKW